MPAGFDPSSMPPDMMNDMRKKMGDPAMMKMMQVSHAGLSFSHMKPVYFLLAAGSIGAALGGSLDRDWDSCTLAPAVDAKHHINVMAVATCWLWRGRSLTPGFQQAAYCTAHC